MEKNNLKNGLDSSRFVQSQMTSFCEHGHETTGSVQKGQFLKH
jgi:hypothetical protein